VSIVTNQTFVFSFLAAEEGYIDVMRLLIDIGADVKAMNEEGIPLLHRCMNWRRRNEGTLKQAFDMLIAGGVDINTPALKTNRTPLHVAAQFGNPAVIKYMLFKGANPEATDFE